MSFNKKPKAINPGEVDPSVYYYDEVYDEMKANEKAEHDALHGHSSKDKKQESKYIQSLKKTAELRKVEKELRKFKRYARDREEAEASGEFPDKDVYVTPAYKEKLKEMKRIEAEKMKLLERERDKSMNFFKKQKIQTETSKEVTKTDSVETNSDLRKPSATVAAIETKSTETKDTEETRDETQGERKIRKKLITLDERREYLRQVLAKRTVGKVYEEAVQRYLERKALAQH